MEHSLLVECVGAARTYGRGPPAVVAVHGATCAVRRGDRIALTGARASGKTTCRRARQPVGQRSAGIGAQRWDRAAGTSDHGCGPGAGPVRAPSPEPATDWSPPPAAATPAIALVRHSRTQTRLATERHRLTVEMHRLLHAVHADQAARLANEDRPDTPTS